MRSWRFETRTCQIITFIAAMAKMMLAKRDTHSGLVKIKRQKLIGSMFS
jgi:hypothetical protein